jgi:hypothetical protein
MTEAMLEGSSVPPLTADLLGEIVTRILAVGASDRAFRELSDGQRGHLPDGDRGAGHLFREGAGAQ